MHGACCFLCEFCPEPPKHIGQPPDVEFVIDEDDIEEIDIPEEQYVWETGVTEGTPLRRCCTCKHEGSYWRHGLCKNQECAWGLAVVEHFSLFSKLAPDFAPSNFDPSKL